MESGLSRRLARIESKLDEVLQSIAKPARAGRAPKPRSLPVEMPHLTPLQHATLQLLVRQASNAEIAFALGVTVDTAKVYVRGVQAKLETKNRSGSAMRGKEWLASITAEDYRVVAGGLPIDWAETRMPRTPDPYEKVLRPNGRRS